MEEHHAVPEAREVLAFRLGQEEYAIDIGKVQELRGYDNVTRIANAPDFIKGVINLRGAIVPVVDMRIKFHLPDPTYDATTVVIVLSIEGSVIGLVVDSVSDVVPLNPDDMKPAPRMGTLVDTEYLIGIATVDQRMLLLTDIAKLLSSTDIGILQRLAA